MDISKDILDILVKYAKKAAEDNEIPVSAVIVDQNGNVVSYGYNNRQNSCNVLGHAEVNAILNAEKKLGDWRLNGYVMYVTLEPCDMCSAVIQECRLDKVFYFLPKGEKNNLFKINKILIEDYDSYKSIFNELLTHFFDNKR